MPYYKLYWGNRSAKASIMRPYATNPYAALGPSLRQGHVLVAAASLVSILCDFLPVLLSHLPFTRTTTWKAHEICTRMSLAVLALMVVVLVILLVHSVARRPMLFFHPSLIRDCPLFGAMILGSDSPQMLRYLDGLSVMSEKEVADAVGRWGVQFRLGSAEHRSDGCHAGINVISGGNDA